MNEGDGGRKPTREAVADSGGRPCPLCETPMYHRHCKYVCPAHGVVYDCSDTFY
ncbi:HVO_2523 family zinc finger protein [Halorubrum sp. Boch-26]|uniref:HVO_2523 family zinc finger protein n=1 Tax=Halorubrum sp. Boch-26 TaxID=2994426 RepID=UPI002469AF4A|nr:HVO_2523 family zinc finger protein [Halorubrum sp. Boch-26]